MRRGLSEVVHSVYNPRWATPLAGRIFEDTAFCSIREGNTNEQGLCSLPEKTLVASRMPFRMVASKVCMVAATHCDTCVVVVFPAYVFRGLY